ncbi:MAG: DNA replication and repair protein RecF [Patescibacteria group bacterium]
MISRLKLENYRNYGKFELVLDKSTVLVGLNGVGKTNILEAVGLLSFGRSFREEDKKNLVKFDADYARITGDELTLYLQKNPRLLAAAKERGVKKKMSEFIGTLLTVVFSPETIEIITGSPAERRRFLDVMISQVEREYLLALSVYNKVRKQRNHLLQRIGAGEASETELKFWDGELVKSAEIINASRREAVVFINKILPDFYANISGEKGEQPKVVYHCKSGDDLAAKLAENWRREVAYGATIYGPHRDDLEFYLDTRNMANFASRGEIRSAILALKVAELEFLEKHVNDRADREEKYASPILLLDDIFSEFDPIRREHLGALILKYQSLITTTEKAHLSAELLKNSKIIELK